MGSQLTPAVSEQDHQHGSGQAPLTIVEYGDYECPHCNKAYPVIKRIQREFGKQVRFVFRNFPLSQSHPMALPAAVAAEAAALQGKYWEMHNTIFENHRLLNNESLFTMAAKAGLDIDRFRDDIQKDELLQKVESDFESGVRSGVNGTPSFFVNGTKFDGGAENLYDMLRENATED